MGKCLRGGVRRGGVRALRGRQGERTPAGRTSFPPEREKGEARQLKGCLTTRRARDDRRRLLHLRRKCMGIDPRLEVQSRSEGLQEHVQRRDSEDNMFGRSTRRSPRGSSSKSKRPLCQLCVSATAVHSTTIFIARAYLAHPRTADSPSTLLPYASRFEKSDGLRNSRWLGYQAVYSWETF